MLEIDTIGLHGRSLHPSMNFWTDIAYTGNVLGDNDDLDCDLLFCPSLGQSLCWKTQPSRRVQSSVIISYTAEHEAPSSTQGTCPGTFPLRCFC